MHIDSRHIQTDIDRHGQTHIHTHTDKQRHTQLETAHCIITVVY